MKKHLLPLAAIALLASSAQATVTDWGTHDPIEMGEVFIPTVGVPTGFADVFFFTVGTGSMLTGTSAEELTTPSLSPIGSARYALLGYGPDNLFGTADDLLVGSWAYGVDTGALLHPLSAGPGRYVYSVTGVATGPVGSGYSIKSFVTAVPAPSIGLALWAALSVVGLLGRRRH